MSTHNNPLSGMAVYPYNPITAVHMMALPLRLSANPLANSALTAANVLFYFIYLDDIMRGLGSRVCVWEYVRLSFN